MRARGKKQSSWTIHSRILGPARPSMALYIGLPWFHYSSHKCELESQLWSEIACSSTCNSQSGRKQTSFTQEVVIEVDSEA